MFRLSVVSIFQLQTDIDLISTHIPEHELDCDCTVDPAVQTLDPFVMFDSHNKS